MARPFAKLRGLMREHEDTQEDIGRILHISSRSVSDRLVGHSEWKLSEMYAILDRYRLPYKDLHRLFPPYGRNE